jgi:hypothetical protein
VLELDAERTEIDKLPAKLLAQTTPGLIGIYGVGKEAQPRCWWPRVTTASG